MAISQHVESRQDRLDQALEFIRTTVIGGALFLLPIFVVLLVLGKVLGMMVGLTEPLVSALGVTTLGGIAVSNLITIFGVLILAFVAGLFARTEVGQSALSWIREGVSATIPQFSLIHDVARKIGADEQVEDIPVVLVPTDAGWALGLLLEQQGDWHTVFLPGAPQMSSGSVAYAHSDQIHRTDITLTQLWALLRARGKGSVKIYDELARLQADGRL